MTIDPWDDFSHPFPPGCNTGQTKTISELREFFALMSDEQMEEFNEYVKLCNGHPISEIKP